MLVLLAVGIMKLVGEHLLVFWLLIGILIAHMFWTKVGTVILKMTMKMTDRGSPIFKISAFFTCFLKSFGHKLSDKVLWRPLASILSDGQPLEFFGVSLEKAKKNASFKSWGWLLAISWLVRLLKLLLKTFWNHAYITFNHSLTSYGF